MNEKATSPVLPRPVLLMAGAIGFATFVFLLPLVHPDASLDLSPASEAEAHVATFVTGHGLDGDEFHRRIRVSRQQDALRRLHDGRSLRALRRSLGDTTHALMGAYTRDFVWYDSSPDDNQVRRVAEVRTLPGGAVAYVDLRRLDRLPADASALREIGYTADEVAGARFVERPSEAEIGEVVLNMDIDAGRLARYHFQRTAYRGLAARVDSVTELEGTEAVRVYMSSDQDIGDLRPSFELDVTTNGALRYFRMQEHQDAEIQAGAEGTVTIGGGAARQGAAGFVSVIGHILLFVALLLMFFRRLTLRMIDAGTAFRDAVWASFWVAVATAFTGGYYLISMMHGSIFGYVLAAIITVLMAALGLMAVFVASAVSDSHVRAHRPASLHAIDLLRRLHFLNRPVGVAVIAGVSLAGLIVGIQTLTLFVPGVSLQLTGELPSARSFRPVVSSFAFAAWSGVYFAMAAVAFPFFALRGRSNALALAAPVVVYFLLDGAPLTITPMLPAMLLSALIGAILIFAVLRFGVLAVITAGAVPVLLFGVAPGWLASGVPEYADAVAAFLIVIGLVTFGLVAIKRGDPAENHDDFVPEYIHEIRRRERVDRELELAREVQQSFLPAMIPVVEGIDAAAVCIPATEVGGDYYDFVRIDDRRLGVIIGDVSGKGITAAFYMTLVKGMVQTLAGAETDPAAVLRDLNRHFYRNASRGAFISLVFGVIDTAQSTFTFARAGHNPVLVGRGGTYRFEKPPGMAIGLVHGERFDRSIQNHVIDLAPNDVILLYTDGLTEAMNSRRQQFGEERLVESLAEQSTSAAADLLADLRQNVDAFTVGQGQADDLTIVAIRITDHIGEKLLDEGATSVRAPM
jgi:phosphoserine phosphatase RsbU/P